MDRARVGDGGRQSGRNNRTVEVSPTAKLAAASSRSVELAGQRIVLPPDSVAILVDEAVR